MSNHQVQENIDYFVEENSSEEEKKDYPRIFMINPIEILLHTVVDRVDNRCERFVTATDVA
jgi:hypothetical protein